MLFCNMKSLFRYPLVSFLLVFISIFIFLKCQKTSEIPAVSEDMPAVRQGVLRTNADFKKQLLELITLIQKGAEQDVAKQKFQALRARYKEMEWAVEYFLPHSARFINGPALPEIEFAEHIELEPEGLQVVEEQIFGEYAENQKEIIRQLKKLLSKSGTIETNFETITVNRSQVMDALRQEIFRVSSLTIAGFDTPVSGWSLKEMPVALGALKPVFKILESEGPMASKINGEIDRAIAYLNNSSDRNSFNYADFITQHLNPIAAASRDFMIAEKIPAVQVTTALRKDARTFYDPNAFDVDAFVPGDNFKISKEKIALGSQLFYDNQLSGSSNRSCASCHNPDKAFTDGLGKSMSLENNPLNRNTPSLNYAAFQHGQFWDMRNEDLEAQSSEVIQNKDEMHGNLEDILAKINNNGKYRSAFKEIYNTEKAEVWQLQNVLASYVRSLATFSSDFDDFMRGKPAALTENQKQGFNLFVGKAKCATCHFLPLFNGTVPPNFTKTEQEVLGTAVDGTNRMLDPDRGRGRFHETVAFLQHSFKTPTLRNVAKTGPYMHNGGYKTLREVMEFYNKGGGKGFNFKIDNQTLPPDPLNLTEQETDKIIDFMNALTDK